MEWKVTFCIGTQFQVCLHGFMRKTDCSCRVDLWIWLAFEKNRWGERFYDLLTFLSPLRFKLYLRSQIYFCGTHLCDGIASLDITPSLRFAVVSVQVFQQSQLHKFHFDFLRLCGLQFCECASFTAVRKFHRRVAHLSSLRACLSGIANSATVAMLSHQQSSK